MALFVAFLIRATLVLSLASLPLISSKDKVDFVMAAFINADPVPKTLPTRVGIHHRIVTTIRIHIVAYEVAVGIHMAIRIDKPTNHGIIIPTLQVIETRLPIVIVTAIEEGIAFGEVVVQRPQIAAKHRPTQHIAPRIVSVGRLLPPHPRGGGRHSLLYFIVFLQIKRRNIVDSIDRDRTVHRKA